MSDTQPEQKWFLLRVGSDGYSFMTYIRLRADLLPREPAELWLKFARTAVKSPDGEVEYALMGAEAKETV